MPNIEDSSIKKSPIPPLFYRWENYTWRKWVDSRGKKVKSIEETCLSISVTARFGYSVKLAVILGVSGLQSPGNLNGIPKHSNIVKERSDPHSPSLPVIVITTPPPTDAATFKSLLLLTPGCHLPSGSVLAFLEKRHALRYI